MGDEKDSSPSPLHMVMFPWLAFGHLLPYLNLAERLASRGHRVSFVSTARNISRLRPVAPSLAPLIGFVALPLPRVDGLLDGAEATSDIPAGKPELHLEAFDGLAAPFSSFLDSAAAGDKKIDWVILDSFQHWAAAAAASRNMPCVLNMVVSVGTLARYGVPDGAPTPLDDLGPSIARRSAKTVEACSLVTFRSCPELEPESVPLLPPIFGKPVIPVGLLPPSPTAGEEHAALAWLDKQPPKSVVYAALGSEAQFTVEQLHEIAHGLELSGARFLWALRKPSHELEEEALVPPGFEERTRGHGLVVVGWVPQLSVLAHGAVGAFLTHCGWSSTIEGIAFGQPLIMLPFWDEQESNARLMEEKQVGVKVPRHGDDRSFDREGVATSVRAVLMSPDPNGTAFASNAKKLQEMFVPGPGKDCHDGHIDEFLRLLTSYKE